MRTHSVPQSSRSEPAVAAHGQLCHHQAREAAFGGAAAGAIARTGSDSFIEVQGQFCAVYLHLSVRRWRMVCRAGLGCVDVFVSVHELSHELRDEGPGCQCRQPRHCGPLREARQHRRGLLRIQLPVRDGAGPGLAQLAARTDAGHGLRTER